MATAFRDGSQRTGASVGGIFATNADEAARLNFKENAPLFQLEDPTTERLIRDEGGHRAGLDWSPAERGDTTLTLDLSRISI